MSASATKRHILVGEGVVSARQTYSRAAGRVQAGSRFLRCEHVVAVVDPESGVSVLPALPAWQQAAVSCPRHVVVSERTRKHRVLPYSGRRYAALLRIFAKERCVSLPWAGRKSKNDRSPQEQKEDGRIVQNEKRGAVAPQHEGALHGQRKKQLVPEKRRALRKVRTQGSGRRSQDESRADGEEKKGVPAGGGTFCRTCRDERPQE